MSEPRDPIRLGIVGTGAISQVVHVPIFAERDDVDLVALADTDLHKAETLSRRFSVPLVLETESLIELDDLDAVVICTPNDGHERLAIEALEAGKHVLVERPVSLTAAGAARVIEAAERTGKVLSVGMPHRFRPEVVALRSFVAGEEMGDLYAVRGSWLTRSIPAMRSTWRADREVAGGGALMDLGVPALDLCMWVIGYPPIRRLSCLLGPMEDGVESAATMILETEEGIAVTLEVSTRFFSGEDRFYIRVMGSEGSGLVPPFEVYKQLGGRPMDVTPRQPKPRGGENPYTNAYRRLLDDFVRRVSGNIDDRLPRDQVQLMALVEAGYESARTGAEIEL